MVGFIHLSYLSRKIAIPSFLDTNTKNKAVVTPLVEFNSKGMFARKKVKGRNFSYEFGRLSKDVQTELDEAIQSVLEKHQ